MSENTAILIDLDNIKPQLREIEDICIQYGTVATRRVFSNTAAVYTAYGSKLRDFGYRLELTPAITPVSQEVDNIIIRTAFELIHNSQLQITTIAIVSNDNDYANLFKELGKQGIKTLAIGNNQLGNKLRDEATYVEIIKNVLRPKYTGIDLGTTNTVIALAQQSLATQHWTASSISIPVKNENEALQNSHLVPSSVRYTQQDKSEVGNHVRNRFYAFRDQTILAWKHDIGTLKDGVPFEYELNIGRIKPEQAAAEVLKFCRQELQKKQIDFGAVITHPASYEPDAIEATRKAAILAGWDEDEIVLLPEPKAALYDFLYRLRNGEVSYDLDIDRPLNILVYDLGGGTLDTSVHKVEWSNDISQFIIDDISIGSRTRVGGDQVDEKIVQYLFDNYSRINKLSKPQQTKLWYELRNNAEKFKQVWGGRYLDSEDKHEFKMPFQYVALEDPQFSIFYNFSYRHMQACLKELLCPDIKPEMLESLDPKTAFNQPPFTDRYNTFVVPVLDVLLKAKDKLGELPKIDAVLLNGGMTYFPLIRERLQQLLPETLILDGDVEQAVARGAALYACGALKPSEGINPTNIWLQVTDTHFGESKLELLVAHGQKYPYQTILNGFRLPDIENGLIEFNIWVGMGDEPNKNTTLQRTRFVKSEEIQASNIQPGDYLNLELVYTFNERLKLTLIHRDSQEARFPLEVDYHRARRTLSTVNSASNSISVPSGISPQDLIPTINRSRPGREPDPNIHVKFEHWGKVAYSLAKNWQNPSIHQQRRHLETQTRQAANRLSIIESLLQWLEKKSTTKNHNLQETQQLIAVMALSNSIQLLPSNTPDFKIRELEQRYHNWILHQFKSGLSRFQNNNDLRSAITHTPGKLIWLDFEELLYQQFAANSNKPSSADILNSFGVCAEPSTRNINRLWSIIQTNNHLALRQKAFWALARLISPGQPPQWQASMDNVEKTAFFVLDQLKNYITKPQVALDALGCLGQCIGWHITANPLPESIINELLSLGRIHLPFSNNFGSYQNISTQFDRKLELIERACDLSSATEEDIKDLKAWFLEIAKA